MTFDPHDPTDPRPDAEGRPDDRRDPTPADRARSPAGAEDPTAVHPDAAAPPPAAPPLDDPPAASPAPVVGLTRSSSDRMLFGVCGGIGARYGFEPLLVRLAFLATLLLGGAGVLLYLAAAILIPADGAEAGSPGAGGGPATTAAGGALRVLVGLAVAIAAFFALCAVAAVSFGTTAFLGAWPAAGALLIVAALLVAAGRSRRTVGTLLVLGLVLAVPATAAVLSGARVDRSVGDRTLRPATVATAEEGYRLGAGRMTMDLRDLPLGRGEQLRIPARVDVGQLGVVLPRTRCVAWTVRTSIGAAGESAILDDPAADGTGFGERGRTVEIDPPRRPGDRRPRVTLDLHVGFGRVAVAHSRAGVDGTRPAGRGIRSRSDDVVRTAACRDEDREAARG